MVPLTCEGRNRAEPRIQISNFILCMSLQDDLLHFESFWTKY